MRIKINKFAPKKELAFDLIEGTTYQASKDNGVIVVDVGNNLNLLLPSLECETDGFVCEAEEVASGLTFLEEKDPELHAALQGTISYITSTYEDKYEFSPLDLDGFIRGSYEGGGFNVGSALKYLKRYLTEGYEKSRNPQDLHKAIHYLLYQVINHHNGEDI